MSSEFVEARTEIDVIFIKLVMHPDLSPHLHTDECNILIQKLLECRSENKVGVWFGKCSELDVQVNKCLKKERQDNRKRNAEAAQKRRERLSPVT